MAVSKDEITIPIRSDNSRQDTSEKSPTHDDDDDYTSSSGSSSEDSDSSEDDSNDNQSLGAHQHLKTNSAPVKVVPNKSLESRLAMFLPQLERANRELEQSGNVHSQRIDDVEEDAEHYVEMDLSLGVLSEQRPDGDTIKTKEGDEEDHVDRSSDTPNDSDIRGLKSEKSQSTKRKVEEL